MKSKRPHSGLLFMGAAIAALALAACGGAAATPAATGGSNGYGGGGQSAAATEAPTEAMPAFGAPAPAAQSLDQAKTGEMLATPAPNATGQGDANNPLVAALPQDRMIVKNGQVTLLVQNTRSAVDQVSQIAVDNGGYLLSSQSSLDAYGVMNATLTIAVRAEQFETALRRLHQIALDVQQETSTGQDVSSEYVDLNSRLANLQATRDRIAKLLDQAKSVEEALTINQQLADIEGQIEQVKGRMTYLSGRSAFSTITVNLNQKVDATPTPTPTITPTPTATSPWSLSPTIRNATNAQLGLVRVLLQVAVWLVVVPGPYALVIGLGMWGFSRWTRRRRLAAPPPPPAPKSEE